MSHCTHSLPRYCSLSSRGNHTRCFADLLLCEQPHHWDVSALKALPGAQRLTAAHAGWQLHMYMLVAEEH